jgi:hypothetical protein
MKLFHFSANKKRAAESGSQGKTGRKIRRYPMKEIV